MFIFEILIYVVFAFFASSLARKSQLFVEQTGRSADLWDANLKWFVAFFTFIAAFRCNVGVDCLSYAHFFAYGIPGESEKEHLFRYLVDFVHDNGLHWTIGLGICGFIQIFFLTAALKPYRWLLVFLPFVFIGGRYWMDCMNAVRQMMAACIFLWASRFIVDGKRWKYVVSILVASSIHHSSLILLPFVLMPAALSLEKRRILLLSIFLSCFVVGLTPAFSSVAGYISNLAGSADYEHYGNSMSAMLTDNYNAEALSYGPMMLSYLLIPIFIIWYGPQLKERYGDEIPYFSLWYNLAYFYACGYFLVCNISHIFIRPMQYFEIFQMVMAAMLLHYLWTEYKAYGARQLATLFFCCVVAINTAWDVTKAATSGSPYDCTTYKFYFFNPEMVRLFGLK